MNRFSFLLALLLLFSGTASAQVTCTRSGDQMFCNGSLQQDRPATPRVYLDPQGSYESGYEAGVRAGRARNLANATQMYLNGEISREDRERFLAYIAKYGGDVTWFRNDMVIRDQQKGIVDSSTAGSVANSVTQADPSPSQATPQSAAERLKQLEALHSSGAISQSEYEAKRKQILDSL